jgi:Ca2+-binding RTX toxin-like protein
MKLQRAQTFQPVKAMAMVLGAVLVMTLLPANATPAFGVACTIVGTNGDDVLTGTPGDDIICGSGGNDEIFGLAGNDRILGGTGNDRIHGGDGADVIEGNEGDDILEGGAGLDLMAGGTGADTLDGGVGDDNLDGGDGSDTVLGGDGDDTVFGGTSADSLEGGPGDDLLDAGDGDDSISGGDGHDTIAGGNGKDSVSAGSGDDKISGGSGDDTILGDAGDDTIEGDTGHDGISGGDGDDDIDGGAGNDRLVGDAGADNLQGATGNDSLDGGAGADVLDAGDGTDSLIGGDGNDTLISGSGHDTADGGNGDDTVNGGVGNDALLGGFGADILVGESGHDTLSGGPGNDALDGGMGTDTCDGATGANTYLNCETQSDDPGTDPGSDPEPTPGPHPEPDPSTWVDTDSDVMPDEVEIRFGSDPLLEDTDGDGLSDAEEFQSLTSPRQSDTDEDGVLDAFDDEDQDGLNNRAEFTAGTNPIIADTDGDGLSDGQEAELGTDPLAPDTDSDGLTDSEEVAQGTDPLAADSDGDGLVDGAETIARSIDFPDSGASFDAEGPASSMINLALQAPAVAEFHDMTGLLSEPVEVVTDGPVAGTLTIPFGTETLSAWSRPAVVHFDTETETFDQPAVQTVDIASGVATVTTDDFSPFFVVDLDEWDYLWNLEHPEPGPRDDYRATQYVLAFDSADGMTAVDPSGKLKPAVSSFIDEIPEDASIGVLDFNGVVTQDSTLDRGAAKTAILQMNDTDLDAGISCDDAGGVGTEAVGVWCQVRRAGYHFTSEQSRHKVIVLFTDNTADDNAGTNFGRLPIAHLEHSGIDMFTVSLGEDVDAYWDWLTGYTSRANHRPVSDLGQLSAALKSIAGEVRSRYWYEDSDGDGLSDAVEEGGVATSFGTWITTDKNLADSDGDGLTDAEELGARRFTSYGSSYQGTSDPKKFDTDGDGIGDGQEADLGTNPRLPDSDMDGLKDLVEVSEGFDPLSTDAESDMRFDDREYNEGTDPFVYDFDLLGNVHAAYSGFAFGDAWDTDAARFLGVNANVAQNGWYVAGQITSGLVVIGDLRDLVYGVAAGRWASAVFALVALVPLAGDAIRVSGILAKAASRGPFATYAAMSFTQALPPSSAASTRKAIVASSGLRLPQDIAISRVAPAANFDIIGGGWVKGVVRRIGSDPAQAQALEAKLAELVRLSDTPGYTVTDVRINQHQVDVAGSRVGINRPDLQYSLNNKRYYVEYDRRICGKDYSRRGEAHRTRIEMNDPEAIGQVILELVGSCE